jgi:hypothetical protein
VLTAFPAFATPLVDDLLCFAPVPVAVAPRGTRNSAREHAYATLESAKAALPVTAVVAEGEGLDWEDGDLPILGSSRLAPPRRL